MLDGAPQKKRQHFLGNPGRVKILDHLGDLPSLAPERPQHAEPQPVSSFKKPEAHHSFGITLVLTSATGDRADVLMANTKKEKIQSKNHIFLVHPTSFQT